MYDVSDALLRLPEQDPLQNSHACLELLGKFAERHTFQSKVDGMLTISSPCPSTMLAIWHPVPGPYQGGLWRDR